MKLKQKIGLSIIVAIIVGLLIFLFIKIFNFEGKNKEVDSFVTDEYVTELYNRMFINANFNDYTYYNGYFTKYNNLNYEYILNVAFQNLKRENDLSVLTKEEFNQKILPNLTSGKNYEPLYKIRENLFEEILKKLYGDEIKLHFGNFQIDNETSGYYLEKEASFYIYKNKNSTDEDKYYIFRDQISYEIANQGQSLIIYDYFIKCNKETTQCFNDSRMVMPNRNINYQENFADTNNIAKYKHTFTLKNDDYYWVSSEMIEN